MDEFIVEGTILGYRTGCSIDSKLMDLVVEKSININKQNFSELVILKVDTVKITMGIDDLSRIKYFMLKLPKYNQNIDILYKDFSLTKNNLNEILTYFNSQSIEWSFVESLAKVLRIKIGKVELVYSYEVDEQGLYCIQNCE
ncbi:hypothetical protein [Flavobacterium subsaxonicum]|uniref:hypothetical protein n=1 Tax=Flavobacterium subsaxonicum TaxID=426226 RepID=UPI00103D6FB8|nr:hypothetical protein [Flavobacterium subsaxonicum]